MGMVSGIASLIEPTTVNAPNTGAVGGDYIALLQGLLRGMPSIYASSDQFTPRYAGLALDTAKGLQPGMTELWDTTTPQNTRLLSDLTASAREGLANGRSFDEASFDRSYRGAEASRGLGRGPGDAVREAIAKSQYGEQLLAGRQATAGAVSGQNYNQRTAPIIQLLTALVENAQNRQITPAQSLELIKIPYAGRLSAELEQQKNRADMINTGSRGFDMSMMGAVAACWVAREVYGDTKPQWMEFRRWLFQRSPRWFRNLYLKYGESFARWLRDKPRTKRIIRRWMDARIASLNPQL